MDQWIELDEERVADMRIFDVTRRTLRNPRNGKDRSIARIESRDWVNVVAVTTDAEVVLVRQWRHGTGHVTLEIPGGLVDAGESPAEAAVRELLEETGFSGGVARALGVVEPNPAFMNNRCHTFLIENCSRSHAQALDDGEDIEVSTVPVGSLRELVTTGAIGHALVICGFWWLALRRPDLMDLHVAGE
jgi:8-oxo-dGTP pyrophosphatase MutT (NUDIX family)